MAYSTAWDEAAPSGGDDANTIDDTIRSLEVAVRERLCDIFYGMVLVDWQADPIKIKGLRGGGSADLTILGGTASTTFKDSTGTNSDLVINHATGDITFRGDVDLAGGFRRSIDGWAITDVAGTVAATEIVRTAGRPQMLRAGSLTSLLVTLENSQARTAGTLTITVWKGTINPSTGLRTDAATALTAVLDGTNPVQKITASVKDAITFAAGDEIFVKYATVGWTPVTADFRVTVEVEH